MSRVFTIVGKLFGPLISNSNSLLIRIIKLITNRFIPILSIGIILVIIGFSVSLVKRIIHS